MHKEDIPQVNLIDREAFPTQWPPPNYRHELGNQLARYIVACDDTKTVELPQPEPRSENGLYGLVSRVRRWFGHEASDESPSAATQYVVGFAGIWVMAEESHLTNIAVRQSYQHRGIGELLLISVIDLSAKLNADTITLEVRVSNTSAQSLYRKYAFTQNGLRRGYYTDNREDAMLMSTQSIKSASFQARFQQLKQAHSGKWGAVNYQLTSYAVPPERR